MVLVTKYGNFTTSHIVINKDDELFSFKDVDGKNRDIAFIDASAVRDEETFFTPSIENESENIDMDALKPMEDIEDEDFDFTLDELEHA